MRFNITVDNFLIYTNPLTYLVLLCILIYAPLNWACRKLQLHNLWFIFFQTEGKSKDGLLRVLEACKRNYRSCDSRWYKYVFALSIVKVRKQIKLFHK